MQSTTSKYLFSHLIQYILLKLLANDVMTTSTDFSLQEQVRVYTNLFLEFV